MRACCPGERALLAAAASHTAAFAHTARTLTGHEAPPALLPVVSVALGAVALEEHVGVLVVAGMLVVLA